MAKKQLVVKPVAKAVKGVFISDASNKDKASAVDLKANAILAQADEQSIIDMQTYYVMSQELDALKAEDTALREQQAKIKEQRSEIKAMSEQCAEFGYRATRGMRVRGMSYDGIKDLWRAVTDGANLPNVLKVSCSLLQNGERLGVKITSDTPRGDCQRAIKAESDKGKAEAEKEAAGTDNQQGTTDGELTDAQVIKQAFALLAVDAGLRQMYAEDFAKIHAKLVADNAKIAAAKVAEGAEAAAKRKAA